MRSILIKLTGILVVIFTLIALLGSVNTETVSADQYQYHPEYDDGGNVSSVSAPPTTWSNRMWDKAEMDAAIPYPMPAPKVGDQPGNRTELPKPAVQGQPLSFPGKGALISQPIGALDLGAPDLRIDPQGYNYPAPFTRYENFDDYKVYPYRTVGKLYFKQYGVSYVCSAASIGNYAVWTAGHCVHAGNGQANGWSTDVVFVPAYKGTGSSSSRPYGTFKYHRLWTRANWYNRGDLEEDMGGAVLSRSGNRKISEKVGYLGFSVNQSWINAWTAIGYPTEAPFNGLRQHICHGSMAYYDYPSGGRNTENFDVAIGCDLTGGASGGPWILGFGSNNYINGQSSFRYAAKPLEMFSPYFGNSALALYNQLISDHP
jgi:V8-like Glu-specific endopeptidase